MQLIVCVYTVFTPSADVINTCVITSYLIYNSWLKTNKQKKEKNNIESIMNLCNIIYPCLGISTLELDTVECESLDRISGLGKFISSVVWLSLVSRDTETSFSWPIGLI